MLGFTLRQPSPKFWFASQHTISARYRREIGLVCLDYLWFKVEIIIFITPGGLIGVSNHSILPFWRGGGELLFVGEVGGIFSFLDAEDLSASFPTGTDFYIRCKQIGVAQGIVLRFTVVTFCSFWSRMEVACSISRVWQTIL